MDISNTFRLYISALFLSGFALCLSCSGSPVSDSGEVSDTSEETICVSWHTPKSLSSQFRGSDGLIYSDISGINPSTGKIAATIEPPLDIVIQDKPSDNGFCVILSWTPSPSEQQGMVSYYRIFQSRSDVPTEPVPCSQFASIDSLLSWDSHYTILMDSVLAGKNSCTAFVPVNGENYHFWLQSVYTADHTFLIGTVTDADGNPLGAAYLRLYNADESVDLHTASKCDGSYTFFNVPPGEYMLVIKREGYTLYSTTVTVE